MSVQENLIIPCLALLKPLHSGSPERLGPTHGRTITILAQLFGKCDNALYLLREYPCLYKQVHASTSHQGGGTISNTFSLQYHGLHTFNMVPKHVHACISMRHHSSVGLIRKLGFVVAG